MAGLQYNFFPTDFFYPRTAPQAANKPVVLPLQTNKLDHVAASDLEQLKALAIQRRGVQAVQVAKSPPMHGWIICKNLMKIDAMNFGVLLLRRSFSIPFL